MNEGKEICDMSHDGREIEAVEFDSEKVEMWRVGDNGVAKNMTTRIKRNDSERF